MGTKITKTSYIMSWTISKKCIATWVWKFIFHTHLDYFPANLGVVREDQGEVSFKMSRRWKESIREFRTWTWLQITAACYNGKFQKVWISGSRPSLLFNVRNEDFTRKLFMLSNRTVTSCCMYSFSPLLLTFLILLINYAFFCLFYCV